MPAGPVGADPFRAGPYDAVLFDLDGVLIDSEVIANRVWVTLLAEQGVHFGEAEFMARAVGSTHRALYDWLRRDHNFTVSDDFVTELDARLMDAFGATPCIEGALDTLEALHAARLPYAVASNSLRSRLHRKLEAAGIAELIGPHAYDPAHVGGRGKPAPDLYEFAARQLGVDIGRCVVIEDSATGASAGARAGATVWGLLAGGHIHPDTEQGLLDAGVTRILHSHGELLEALGLVVPA